MTSAFSSGRDNLDRRAAARRGLRLAIAVATVAATLLPPSTALRSLSAQPAQRAEAAPPQKDQPGGIDPNSIYGRESTEGVYVRDSAVAIEKIALAERMERLSEWNKSADLYQEILQTFADRVLPSQVDAKTNKIYQYTSVSLAVQERLARWPAAGLAVYRGRFEPLAAELLAKALPTDDQAGLHKVLALYFVTDAARQAGLRLVELYLEDGDFAAAAWTGDRLLNFHPGLGAEEKPALLYRVALAYHLAGDKPNSTARFDRLKREFPAATATIGGVDQPLATALEAELAKAPAAARTLAADSWPMPFGSPDRSRVPAGGAAKMAQTFSVDIQPPSFRGLAAANAQQVRQFRISREKEAGRGNLTGVLPAVDGDEMYFQDNARVYAVSLVSGMPLSGWLATYPGDRNGTFSLGIEAATPTPRGVQLGVAVTDEAVLAVMGQPDDWLAMQGIGGSGAEPQLVCLDRATGKKRWSVGPQSLDAPDGQRSVRQVRLVGTPLVVGDSVYVAAKGRGGQFEESQVLCFSMETGRLRWSSYVASANGGNAMMWAGGDMDPTGRPSGIGQLAYASGRIYVLTNIGALAALDAYTGTMVWLNIYPRGGAEAVDPMGRRRFSGGARQQSDNARPFQQNPVLIKDGRLFVLPADADHMHVYDSGTGVELQRIKLAHGGDANNPANQLLGVVDDAVLLANDRLVTAIDWRKYDRDKFRTTGIDPSLVWKTGSIMFQGGGEDDRGPIRGRPFLTADALFVPTSRDLRRYDLAGDEAGTLRETYPASGKWDDTESPGNVLVLRDYVIIAGPDKINVYADPKLVRQRLDDAEKAEPASPNPRLRYAEVMFVAGDRDLAVKKLDEAVALGGGLNNVADPEVRQTLFAASLSLADKVLREIEAKRGNDDPANAARRDLANGLLDRAATLAQQPEARYQAIAARVRLAGTQGDLPAQLKLYHEVLASPALRAVPVTGGGPTAGALAEGRVGEIVQRMGADALKPYEQQASDALAAARGANNPEAIAEVAAAFPNTAVARDALRESAEAWEKAGNQLAATQVLRRLVLKTADDAAKAPLYEGLARNYLAMPQRSEVALARLRQVVKANPSARLSAGIKLPDGRAFDAGAPVKDVLDAVSLSLAQATRQALPDLNLPGRDDAGRNQAVASPFVDPAQAPAIANVVAVLRPSRAAAGPRDRLIAVAADDTLLLLKTFQTDPIARLGKLPGAAGYAWAEGNSPVVWGGRTVARFDADGKPLWSVDLGRAAAPAGDGEAGDLTDGDESGEPQAGGENDDVQNFGGVRRIVRADGAVIIIQNNGRVIRRNVNIGGNAVQPGAGGAAGNVPNVGNGEQVAAVRVTGDRVVVNTSTGRLLAFKLADGSLQWQQKFGAGKARRLEATDDFVAALQTDDENGGPSTLVALDAATGQLRFRQKLSQQQGGGISNFDLARDGTLVWLYETMICGKDLFEPGGEPTWKNTSVGMPVNGAPLMANRTEDQLVVADGRIYGLVNAGQQTQSVRVWSLADGKPIKYRSRNKDIEASFSPEAQQQPVRLFVESSRLYLAGPRSLVVWDIETGNREWARGARAATDAAKAETIRDLVFARDYLVSVDQSAQPKAPVVLSCYSRQLVDGKAESGNLDYRVVIPDAAGAARNQWIAVDGGLAYVAAGNQLKFLKGAKQ
jgi:outer membrane protein assembly factor BamB/tetratricopeptide (TPR) repeat protein